MIEDIKSQIDFSIIRYANCWEDADLLMNALPTKFGDTVLSIASAGDNSFAFLVNDGVQVMAVDVSDVQLMLCKIKQYAIKNMTCQEYHGFLGFSHLDNRFEKIVGLIPVSDTIAHTFINQFRSEIETGIGYAGKFESYFKKFKKYLLPLVHNKTTVQKLFAIKSSEEQIKFYNETWNTLSWRLLLKLFFSKFVLGRMGRDPEMLNEVTINVGDYIKSKADEHLQSTACQHNYLLQMIMTGTFINDVPFYLREENYKVIQRNIDNITFFKGYPQDAPLINGKKYNHANLSNIFEYMNKPTFEHVTKSIDEQMAIGASIAYWNLMVPRNMSQVVNYKNISLGNIKPDNGFFYHKFVINQK